MYIGALILQRERVIAFSYFDGVLPSVIMEVFPSFLKGGHHSCIGHVPCPLYYYVSMYIMEINMPFSYDMLSEAFVAHV